jgi:hypothetical protein
MQTVHQYPQDQSQYRVSFDTVDSKGAADKAELSTDKYCRHRHKTVVKK